MALGIESKMKFEHTIKNNSYHCTNRTLKALFVVQLVYNHSTNNRYHSQVKLLQ